MANYSTKPLFKGTQIIWYILTIVEVILLLRFALKLLGANPNAEFTNFVYSLSLTFVAPFQAVFQNSAMQGNVFEWTTLLAMLVYYIIALILVQLLVMGKPVSEGEAESKLGAQDNTL